MRNFFRLFISALTCTYISYFPNESFAQRNQSSINGHSQIERMRDALGRWDYDKCLQVYDSLPKDKRYGEASYCEGYALMQLHKLDEAKPFFKKAQDTDFSGYKGWDTTQEILSKIEEYEKYMPPEIEDYFDKSGKPAIRVYASHSAWTDKLLPEISNFLDHATEVFGDKLPPIKLVIFKDRRSFDRCYEILFGYTNGKAENFGTGMKNIVIFCEQGLGNVADSYKKDPNYPPGALMHEYAHALFRTIMGSSFEYTIPRWLDEGLADLFARRYLGKGLTSRSLRYIESKLTQPPAYLLLSEYFQGNQDYLAYALSQLTVSELFGNNPDKLIYPFLKKACELHDANAAAKVLLKTDLQTAYDKVIQKYWGKKNHFDGTN